MKVEHLVRTKGTLFREKAKCYPAFFGRQQSAAQVSTLYLPLKVIP